MNVALPNLAGPPILYDEAVLLLVTISAVVIIRRLVGQRG